MTDIYYFLLKLAKTNKKKLYLSESAERVKNTLNCITPHVSTFNISPSNIYWEIFSNISVAIPVSQKRTRKLIGNNIFPIINEIDLTRSITQNITYCAGLQHNQVDAVVVGGVIINITSKHMLWKSSRKDNKVLEATFNQCIIYASAMMM